MTKKSFLFSLLGGMAFGLVASAFESWLLAFGFIFVASIAWTFAGYLMLGKE